MTVTPEQERFVSKGKKREKGEGRRDAEEGEGKGGRGDGRSDGALVSSDLLPSRISPTPGQHSPRRPEEGKEEEKGGRKRNSNKKKRRKEEEGKRGYGAFLPPARAVY